MRRENSDFKTKFISESGSYLQNRDYFAFVELEDCACYCIADGIDEDVRKYSAKLAVSAAIEAFHENPKFSRMAIKRYMTIANDELHRESSDARLEASMVIAITNYKKIIWAYAGNSRLYLVRNENIRYQTQDHSLSQNLANEGEIPIDQIGFHEERHNLYSYVGQAGRFAPTISKKYKLVDGDIIMLLTRGVWQGIGTAELLDAIEGIDGPEKVCLGLEEVVLSQQDGILDNYTIASVFINKIYRNPNANRNKKLIKLGTTILALLLMVCLTLFIVFFNKSRSNYKSMMASVNKGVKLLEEKNYIDAISEMENALESSERVRTINREKNRQILIVNEYSELSSILSSAKEFLDNGFYGNAERKFNEASNAFANIKEQYEVDMDIEKVINAYEQYSKYMNEADELVKAGDYSLAADSYENARKAGIETEDMNVQIISEAKKNKALALNFAAIGDQYLVKAKGYFDSGEYTGALTHYQAASNSYNKAKELSDDVDMIRNIESAELGISNASSAISNQTLQEKENEALKHIDEGDKKYKKQEYEKAIASYENAKKIYSDIGKSDMLSIVVGYIEKAQLQIDSEEEKEQQQASKTAEKEFKAAQYLLKASEYFAEGSYVKASDNYSLAMDIYKELEKNEDVKTLQRIIKNIEALQTR